MRKYSIALLVVTLVIFLVSHDAEGMTQLEQERIRSGMKAAAAIAKTMKALEAVKWVAKIGSVAGPLMSVAVLALEIAMMFIKIESPEMILMKSEFSNLNARLDQFSVQFAEVKRKIKWSAIQLSYAKYERTIRVLNDDRLALSKIKDKLRFEQAKLRYISKYESDFDLASEKLYQAMTTKSVLSNNIFHAARTYTENHEQLTFEFIKGTIQLLIQAYSIEISYLQLKYNDSFAIEFFKKEVERKLGEVQQNANAVQNQIRSLWVNQMKLDVKNQVIMSKGSSNEYFSKHLYNFLDQKYPWRQWFVLAYAEATDSRKHAAHTCGGVRYINLGKRNTVVSSVEKSVTTSFSKVWAHDRMRTLSKFRVYGSYGQKVLDSMMRFNDASRCNPAAVMAAVRRRDHREFVADAWIYTNRKRLHWEQFCVYKCNTDLCWVKKDKCFAAILWG